jgi:acetyl esterase
MSADSTPPPQSRLIDLSVFSAEPSEETKRFNAAFEAKLANMPAAHEVPPAVTRRARDEGKSIFPLAGPLEGSEWWDIPGYRGRDARVRVTMPEGHPKGVYLHVHGGGWTLGSPAHFDLYNQRLAKAAGVAVASVEYRLAPENPWPAGPDDVWAAVLWLLVRQGAIRHGQVSDRRRERRRASDLYRAPAGEKGRHGRSLPRRSADVWLL